MKLRDKRHLHAEDKYDSVAYLILRLFDEHIKQYSKLLLVGLLCMLVVSISTALQSWLIKPILDEIFVAKNKDMLYIIPSLFILNTAIKCVASFYESSNMKLVGQKIVSNIQLKLYAHLIRSDIRFLEDYPSGNLISRFTNDINTMKRSVSDILTGMIKEFLTVICLIFVMFYQSTQLALIAVFIFPIAVYPIIKFGKRMRKISKSIQEHLSNFTVRLDETFKNIKIIKSYSREDYETARATKTIDEFLHTYKKSSYIEAALSPIMEALGGVVVSLIILYGGSQVLSEQLTPGSFFSFITALLMAYKPLKAISKLNSALQEGMAASKRLFTMMDADPTISDCGAGANEKFELKNYDISFSDVYFSYRDENKILDDVHLDIKQGQTVALVGTSGSGKTTILNLLQRLYECDYGNISIGGHNIKDIPISVLRKSTALVSQDENLFNDTIESNIRYGNLSASKDELLDASMAAAAHDFIISLPNGYDTNVGESGSQISGGQKQRIAIARAILKNAPILLLDEATSALDAISENQVHMALDYLKKGRTTIVIAHRLSTVENADYIYVLSNGKITEHGTHHTLVRKGKEYAKLYKQYKSHGDDFT